jgi:hypothetical protein
MRLGRVTAAGSSWRLPAMNGEALHPPGLLLISREPLTGAASGSGPAASFGDVRAPHLLDSPTPDAEK